ncbi:MAG: hypothetical protein OXG44_02395, partial [Gammaproteobacteria bacterium]|nr:hypothetical protein [Gammaproteobacteria bacterium]
SDQRRYLRDGFDGARRSNSSAAFVGALSNVSTIFASAWRVDAAQPFPGLDIRSDLALLALRILRDLNHTVTVAPVGTCQRQ